EEMDGRRLVLVHGDYSPKNMLVEPDADVIFLIDFEVVHYGDPAFDTGFGLNHLLLKSFHRPHDGPALLEAARALWQAYRQGVPVGLSSVVDPAPCRHLGALLLARVDGKSPVEYLSEETRRRVRDAARRLLLNPLNRLDDLFRVIQRSL